MIVLEFKAQGKTTATAKNLFREGKATQSLRKTVAQSSTKRRAGNFPKTGNKSLSLIRKGLVGSS